MCLGLWYNSILRGVDKIIPSFKDSLFSDSTDVLEDIAELGIDSLLDDGLFKDFPIVGFLIGVTKITQNIHDRNLLKQTLNFIKQFNVGKIDAEKLEKYRNEINCNNKKAEEELGRVLIILNNNVELQKSTILANLFRNYVNEKINWFEFCEFSEIVRMLFIRDLETLNKIYIGKFRETKDYSIIPINRLKSSGLIDTSEKRNEISFAKDVGYSPINCNISLTKIGGLFYNSIMFE